MLSVIPMAGVLFKFLLFNAIWCYYTTFTPFSCWESYATVLAATLILSVPYILTRRIAASILVMVILDIWLVANLLYYRSYFSAIPLSSYLLAGNLVNFLPSVTASFRWCDGLFPASTAAIVFFMLWRKHRSKIIFPFGRRAFFTLLLSLCALLAVNFSIRGGFFAVYGGLELPIDTQAVRRFIHYSARSILIMPTNSPNLRKSRNMKFTLGFRRDRH